ncbi:MAG: hypothetical protein C0404_04165 [Verrucomicrobia bacterium]|nr:hypothetical protein [Verrucomicrobiota bacterium]
MKKVAKKPVEKSPVKKVDAAKNKKQKQEVVEEAPVVKAVPMPKNKLPAKERNDLRDRLIGMRQGLSDRIKSLKDESLTRRDDVNDVEDGTDAFDRQFSLNIVSTENDSVFEIDYALRRLDEGTYGVCEQCRKLIEKKRIEALPFVRLCVACQSETEKGKPKFRPMNEDEGI